MYFKSLKTNPFWQETVVPGHSYAGHATNYANHSFGVSPRNFTIMTEAQIAHDYTSFSAGDLAALASIGQQVANWPGTADLVICPSGELLDTDMSMLMYRFMDSCRMVTDISRDLYVPSTLPSHCGVWGMGGNRTNQTLSPDAYVSNVSCNEVVVGDPGALAGVLVSGQDVVTGNGYNLTNVLPWHTDFNIWTNVLAARLQNFVPGAPREECAPFVLAYDSRGWYLPVRQFHQADLATFTILGPAPWLGAWVQRMDASGNYFTFNATGPIYRSGDSRSESLTFGQSKLDVYLDQDPIDVTEVNPPYSLAYPSAFMQGVRGAGMLFSHLVAYSGTFNSKNDPLTYVTVVENFNDPNRNTPSEGAASSSVGSLVAGLPFYPREGAIIMPYHDNFQWRMFANSLQVPTSNVDHYQVTTDMGGTPTPMDFHVQKLSDRQGVVDAVDILQGAGSIIRAAFNGGSDFAQTTTGPVELELDTSFLARGGATSRFGTMAWVLQ